MRSTKTKLQCPKCKYPIDVVVETTPSEFLYYVCPGCHSNIVYYDKKLDIISDKMVEKISKAENLELNDMIDIKDQCPNITQDDINDLKIALETSNNIDDFLKKI